MFRANVEQVLQWLAELRGLNILVDPRVSGELSIMAAEPVTPEQAESLVFSALDMYGYGVEQDGNRLRVMPAQSAGPGNIVESFTGPANAARVIVLYWPKTVGAQSLAKLMGPLKGSKGFIQAFDNDQALLLSDAGDRVKRLLKLAEMLDSGADRTPAFFPLEHADATAMATLLKGLFDGQRLTIAADEYSSVVLVSAPPALLKQVGRVIQQLDQRLVSSEETEVVDLKFSQASDLLPALQSVNERKSSDEALQGRGHIEAVESANALILAGPAPWRSATRAVIARLDQPRQQVLVESVIMEVSDSLISELGVEWNTDVQGDGVEALTRFGIQNAEIPPVIQEWSGAGLALGWFRNGSLRAVVRAAANDTGTRILSTPRLATLDHAPAEILVGSNIPVKTGEALLDGNGQGQPFTTIERKDIGIALKVTPHINADGDVTLEIEQTVESITPTSSSSTDIITNKRQLKTRVRVQNETVLVLGGLSSQENNEIVDKVPLLGDIPMLGALFRNTRNETVNRHLMVFIQPKLITDTVIAGEETSKAMQLVRDARSQSGEKIEAIQNTASQEDEWQTLTPNPPAETAMAELTKPRLQSKPGTSSELKPAPADAAMASMAEPITATPSVPQPQKEQEQKQESVIPEPEIETTPTTATELPFNSDPEPVYAEETIELDDAVADQTRSQGIRGAFVALPETAAHPAPQTTNPDVPKPVREDKLIQPQQAPSKRPALEANTAPTATARSTGKAPASQNVVSKQSTAPVVAEKAETRRTAPAKQEIKPQLKPALSEPAIERPAKSSANSQSDYQWP